MSLSISTQNAEIGHCDHQGVAPSLANLPTGNDVNMEVEEEDEEEEDMDFNPFLRGETPSEASSSLSSECEGDNAERNLGSFSNGKDATVSSIPTEETQCCYPDSKNEDIDIILQTRLSTEAAHGRDVFSGNPKEKELTSSIQQGERLTCPEESSKVLSSGNGSDAANYLTREGTSQKPIIEIDDEDAICRRTRARHSLANYTLEELETFLQGSDDDGDIHNIDDEEEYHKFLAAVLLEGADGEQVGQEDENIDEDEENDADFEIEIEEALESDVDESIDYNKGWDGKQEGDAYMPETRQKKRLKESSKNKKHLLGQPKTPLRPLLPYVSNAQIAPFPTHGWKFSSSESISHCSSSLSGADSINGFTAHQVGQLYCLIHEHVQLLIQVFSVCVLDPSRQQVVSGVQKMISEMNNRREEALARRKVSYQGFYFHPSNLHSSLQFDFHQTANCSYWTPLIDNPVLSILDVAPLRLVKSYMTDVSDTVLRYRQSHVEDVADKSHLIREPLFPLPIFASPSDTNNDNLGGTTTMSSNIHSFLPLSPGQVQPKKSLATMLVESTRKQSVALVPKDIAKSAQRFYPLFNSALFPHKPPVPAVANRVLFTDAEDGLLAMGLMEYNNDWAAIQQRFLPCKSKHQETAKLVVITAELTNYSIVCTTPDSFVLDGRITSNLKRTLIIIFVRQKNRSSSKAPENPIKAVRRMKTSPLTADEQARIYEGLKLFKHDWLSVWKFMVPHRDPSLLPRQWRIATGTQKSYRKSEALKEKRRLYEAKRRKFKASMADCQTSSEQEVDNGRENSAGDMDGVDEAYVHEAFLADSEPGSSKRMSCDTPLPSINRSNIPSINMMPFKGSYISENCAFVRNECGESQQKSGLGHLTSLQDACPSYFSQVRYSTSSKQLSSNSISRPSNGHLVMRPCQTRKSKGVRVVKLAPDLPPVNLPPSVRVISQSAFKSYHSESPCSKIGENAIRKHVRSFPRVAKVGTSILNPGEHLNKSPDNGLDTSRQRGGGTLASQFGAEENTSESDLHMHPLLFQAPEDQFSSYFSMNSHTAASSTHNFFPGNPLQADPNLLRPQRPVGAIDRTNVTQHSEEAPSDLCTIDFHPLLQRIDNLSGDSATVPTVYQLSSDLRAPQCNCDKFFDPSDCILRAPLVGDGQVATSTASPRHYGKENKLDLDIRLCSAPDKDKTEGRDMNEHHSVEATIPTLEHRMAEKGLHAEMPFLNSSNKCPEGSVTINSSVQSLTCSQKDVFSFEVVPPSNGGACQCMGDLCDESIPGIVMEQEELSDSEEEIEHVEFEREEIDDSEGDELGSEQPTALQNKEFPFFTSKREEIQANHNLRPLQSRSLKKGSVGKDENCTGPMQVSQDSRHAKLSRLKPKRDSAKRSRQSSSSPNVLQSQPGRSSKKQSAESSKLHPLRTVQCKAAASSRKLKKRSL